MSGRINRLLNNVPLLLSEICIGNLFIYENKQINITGIHISGRIEAAFTDTKIVFEIDDYKLINPIELPINNTILLSLKLRDTEFVCKRDGLYIMNFNGSDIVLLLNVLENNWSITYNSEDFVLLMPLYYIHELQNAFYIITSKRMMFK